MILQVHDELLIEAAEEEVDGSEKNLKRRDGTCSESVSSASGRYAYRKELV